MCYIPAYMNYCKIKEYEQIYKVEYADMQYYQYWSYMKSKFSIIICLARGARTHMRTLSNDNKSIYVLETRNA